MQIVKCVVVGDSTCGKTCMLEAYINGSMPDTFVPTVYKTYSVPVTIDSESIELALTDTGGAEGYDSLRPVAYPETDVFIVCADLSRPAELVLDNVRLNWFPEVSNHCPNAPIILVGTKRDLRTDYLKANIAEHKNETFLTAERGNEFIKEIKAVKYLECSALTQHGLKEVFEEAARLVLKSSESRKRKKKQSKHHGPEASAVGVTKDSDVATPPEVTNIKSPSSIKAFFRGLRHGKKSYSFETYEKSQEKTAKAQEKSCEKTDSAIAKKSKKVAKPQEPNDFSGAEESKEQAKPREPTDTEHAEDSKDQTEPREPTDVEDVEDLKEQAEPREPIDVEDVGDLKEQAEPREPNDAEDAKDSKDQAEPRGPTDAEDTKDSKEQDEPREPEDISDSEESTEPASSPKILEKQELSEDEPSEPSTVCVEKDMEPTRIDTRTDVKEPSEESDSHLEPAVLFQFTDPKEKGHTTTLKIVLVGDAAVGKTSLLTTFAENQCPQEYVPTEADDCFSVEGSLAGSHLCLRLWDVSCAKSFENLRPLRYRQTDVCLICFSLISSASFESVRTKWYSELSLHCPDKPILLVGTKMDLWDDPETIDKLNEKNLAPITEQQGKQMAEGIGAEVYIECSALNRKSVENVFKEAVLASVRTRHSTDQESLDQSRTSGAE